ncbi:MAG TPA: GAF domain-containing protein [Gaiellales bacterium]|nr:GAF domain-containing protein [Gaiellales bacterium]
MSATAPDNRLQALLDAGVAIAGGLELRQILPRLVQTACDLTGAKYGALGVLDESGNRLAQFITAGLSDEERDSIGDLPTGRGILGVLITDARPLRLPDIGTDPRSVGFPPRHPPMRSFLGVPVIAGGSVFGNLYLTEKAAGDFTEADEGVAVMLAAQAGVAIQNARLFADAKSHADALERAWTELSSVDELLGAILSGGERDSVLQLLADQAVRVIPSAVIGIALPEEDRTMLRYVAAAGERADRLRQHTVPVGGSKVGAALLARRVVRVDDLESDPDAYAPTGRIAGVRSLLIVPIVRRFEAVGVIVAGDRQTPEALEGEDERLLQAYATRTVLVLELAQALATERDRANAVERLVASEIRDAARRETLRRVVDAQERERRRLAIELHDETGQSLAAVLMGLRRLEESGDPATVRATVEELRGTVVNAVQELRALAVELRPKALDDFGLAPALERLIDTYSRRTGLEVDSHLAGLEPRLDEPIESALYRIAQEALTNIAKHAGASAVSIVTRRTGERLTMIVEDNGTGFDATAPAEGLGLVSMRERAELLGGSLRLESSTEHGTTLVVEVPA